MAFDFFFTHPYQSLKIEQAEDIGTAVLLLAIGLLVAQLTDFAHQSRLRSERTHDELLRVHQVSELAAQGMAIDDLVRAVETELTGLLALRECHYETEPRSDALPVLGRNGSLEYGRRRWVGPELSLPAEGAEIAVLGRGPSSAGSCSCPISTPACRSRSGAPRWRSPTSSVRPSRRTPPSMRRETAASRIPDSPPLVTP